MEEDERHGKRQGGGVKAQQQILWVSIPRWWVGGWRITRLSFDSQNVQQKAQELKEEDESEYGKTADHNDGGGGDTDPQRRQQAGTRWIGEGS